MDDPITLKNAFYMADNVLRQGVQCISEAINVPGLINLDFADVESVMKNMGYAHMGVGRASGKDKARVAASMAIDSPLLETKIDGCKGIILNITASADIDLNDVELAANMFKEAADPDANIIWGVAFNDDMDDEMSITAIAAGFDEPFLRKFRPDIVIGCGGYVSGPVVMQASRLGIKTAIHEQNSFPGVTTRILSKKVDLILAPNEDAKQKIGKPEKTVIVGNPVSSKIIEADREAAREKLGIGDRTCILSFGGSLGAKVINDIVARMFKLCKGRDDIFFIHATGGYDTETFPRELKEEGVSLEDLPCRVSTYIDDMPDCLAASDLVVSRSGAITISELAVSGRPSYLIPSPHVAENHQYYNALTLSSRGAAVLEEEKDMIPDRTAEAIIALAEDKERPITRSIIIRTWD